VASRIAFVVLLGLAFQPELGSGQPASNVSSAALNKKQTQFAGYAHDFIDFARVEYDPSSDLTNVAQTAGDYAGSAGTLLEIYDGLSCEQDRTTARAVVKREFGYYSKQLALQMEIVHMGVGYTKKAGVAAEALRMQDELQELKNLFDSFKTE
jgi:hypothetical protein